jgi:WD40 repeat protein
VHAWKLAPRDGGRAITPKDRVTAVRFAEDGRSLLWIETVLRRTDDNSVFDKPWRGEAVVSQQNGDPPLPKRRLLITDNGWLSVYEDDTTFRFDLSTGETTPHKGRSPEFPRDDPPPGRHVDARGDEWAFEVEGKPRDSAVRTARLTNRRTGDRRVLRFDLPKGSVDLGPTPDGQCVLFGYENGTVEFRDVWTGRVRATLTGHTAPVAWAVWAPDGTALATRSEGGPIRVWDLRPPVAAGRWQSFGMTFTHDGRSLISLEHASDSLAVRSLVTGRVERLIPPANVNLDHKRLSVSTDGRYLFGTGGSGLYARDLATGEDVSGPFGKSEPTTHKTAAAPDGSFVVGLQLHRSGGTKERPEHEARLVRMDIPGGTLTEIAQFPARALVVLEGWDLRVTADSRQVILARPAEARGGVDKQTHILAWYDAQTREPLRETGLAYTSNAFGQTVLTLDQEGKLALVCSPDHQFRVWDLRTGKEKWRLPPRGHGYPAAAFSPDSKWLAAGDEYGTVWVWEAETGRQAAVFHARSVLTGALHLSIRELCFDPAGRRLVARVGYLAPPRSMPDQIVVWNFSPENAPARGGK